MKKAFIVTFEISTRVVVDVPKDFANPIIDLSKEGMQEAYNKTVAEGCKHILSNPTGYLDESNASVYFDKECPYDPETDD